MKISLLIILLLVVTSVAAESIDVNELLPGEFIITEWEGFPVYVYKRTNKEIGIISKKRIQFNENKFNHIITHTAKIYGNKVATNILSSSIKLESLPQRSIRKDVLVVLGLSSYFGCLINIGTDSFNLIDPCSNAEYGINGQILKTNSREFYHLLIPPHHYQDYNLIIENSTDIVIDFTPDIMSKNTSSGEKLMMAIDWRKEEIAKKLLNDPDVILYRTITGASPLHAAASKSSSNLLEVLIKKGFQVNVLTKNGISPLQMALISKNEGNAKVLLKHGAETNKFCIESICSENAASQLAKWNSSISKKEANEYISNLHQNSYK